MNTPYPLVRARPPWPGVLPLAEAAALLSVEVPALRQRWRRGKQPGFKRGDRLSIVLLPHQWASWAERYVHPVQPPRESGTHPGEPVPQAPLLAALEQLRADRRELREAWQEAGYWRGKAQALEAELAAVKGVVHRFTEQGVHPVLPEYTPVPWWKAVARRFGF